MRRLSRTLTAAAAAALVIAPAGAASAHGANPHVRTGTAALPTPILASPNVHLLANFPDTQMISGVFSPDGKFFYSSSADSISVYDTSTPTLPVLKGILPNLVFENEAMTYGEKRDAFGKLTARFVLVGVDLYNVSGDPEHIDALGKRLLVIDVTNPTNPFIRSSTPSSASAPGAVTTSTHTVTCSNVARCEWAYSAGTGGVFSVIDLRDLNNPKQAKTLKSPANGPGLTFRTGAGHKFDIDDAGYAFHTGSVGGALFDTRHRQGNPLLINATNPQGNQTPYNDFILHNSQRPNAKLFQPYTAPSVNKGNVLLITEEDYFNDGDETACDKAGTIQTWYVPTLVDPDGVSATMPGTGNIRPLDIANIPNENPVGGLTTPVGAFCSAHWFDFHQSGILAQGYYQQGLRFVDVRDPYNIKQYGYFTGGASEVWDAYWVPTGKRNPNGSAIKSNIVYTADFVRGIDVLCVELPGQATCPSPVPATAAKASTRPGPVSAMALPLVGITALLGVATRIRRRLER
ncbi:MAG: hypothetical protein ACR2J0_04560 [Mycobacteriales bacterium]